MCVVCRIKTERKHLFLTSQEVFMLDLDRGSVPPGLSVSRQ